MKKILSVILVLITAFCVISSPHEAVYSARAVKNDKAEELSAIGILSGVPALSAKTLRGEFVRAACLMLSDEIIKTTAELPFSDISGSPHKDAIVMAVGYGMVSGSGGGRFEPDKAITYEQAVKIIVSALGYDKMALSSGEYPHNYIGIGARIGLLKGVSSSVGNEMTNEETINLLYNAIRTDIAVPTSFGSDMIEYEKSEGKKILAERRNIYTVSGIVSQNYYTSLTGDSSVREGEVSIGNLTCNIGSSIAGDCLGMNVSAYLYIPEDDTQKKNILYVMPVERTNEILVIDGELISTVSDRLTAIQYYTNKEKIKTLNVKISPTAKIIYNGKAYPDCPSTDIEGIVGDIRLIDNNTDGQYDVVLVTSYEFMLVKTVAQSSKTVFNHYESGGMLTSLSFDDENYDYIFTAEGEKADFYDMKLWDVLNITRSKSGRRGLVTVEITTDALDDGIIEEINEADFEVTVDGTVFKLAKDYLKALNAKNPVDIFVTRLEPGEAYTIYFDMFENIYAVGSKTDAELIYGYLKAVKQKESVSGEIYARILTQDGDWVDFELAEKPLYDGTRHYSDYVFGELDNNPQLLKYKVNQSGKISEIYPALPSTQYIKDVFTVNNYTSKPYYATNNSFSSDVYLKRTTTVFVLPTNPDADIEDYFVTTSGYFAADRPYTFSAYDLDEFFFTDALVLVDDNETRGDRARRSGMFIVDKLADSDMDGDLVKKIYGHMASYINISAVGKDRNMFDSYQKGDIVLLSVNRNSRVETVLPIYSISTGAAPIPQTNIQQGNTILAGTVVKSDFENERIILDTGTNRYLRLPKSIPMMVYKKESNAALRADTSDIQAGDFVVFKITWSNPVEGVVIRFNE